MCDGAVPIDIEAHVPPVRCPLNEDGTLSIGTLQAAMPGAGGLYYCVDDNVNRCVLRVDRQSGVIYPPPNGWNSVAKFNVTFFQPARHCGHCCMQSNRMQEEYSKATHTFTQSLKSVQQLMAQGEEENYEMDDQLVEQIVNQTQAMMGQVNSLLPQSNGSPQEQQPQQLELLQTQLKQQMASAKSTEEEREGEKEKHAEEMERMKAKYEEEMEGAKAKYQEEINGEKEKHEGEVREEKEKHEGEVREEKEKHEGEMREEKEKHGAEMRGKKEKHEEVLGELGRDINRKDEQIFDLQNSLSESQGQQSAGAAERCDSQRRLMELGEQMRLMETSPPTSPMDETPDILGEEGEGKRKVSMEGMRQRMNRLAESKAKYKAEVEHLTRKLHDDTDAVVPPPSIVDMTAELSAERDRVTVDLDHAKSHIAWLESELEKTHQDKNDKEWRMGEMQGEINQKEGALHSAEESLRRMIEERKGEVHRSSSRGSMHGDNDIDEMHLELRKALEARRQMETTVAGLNNDLQQSQHKDQSNGDRVRELEKEIWICKEEKASAESQMAQGDELEGQLRELHTVADAKQAHIMHIEKLLHDLQTERNHLSDRFDGALIIKKQPYLDRQKWRLAAWQPQPEIYEKVWFEITYREPIHFDVYLLASFFNWECAVLCTDQKDGSCRHGVWVYVPKGRHEFRFVVDGVWHTSGDYERCWNDFGTQNNVLNA